MARLAACVLEACGVTERIACLISGAAILSCRWLPLDRQGRDGTADRAVLDPLPGLPYSAAIDACVRADADCVVGLTDGAAELEGASATAT